MVSLEKWLILTPLQKLPKNAGDLGKFIVAKGLSCPKSNKSPNMVTLSITVQMTSCLTGLDLTKHVKLLFIHHKQSSWNETNKTGGQPYSDTSSYKVSEYYFTEYYLSTQYLSGTVGRYCAHGVWCLLRKIAYNVFIIVAKR